MDDLNPAAGGMQSDCEKPFAPSWGGRPRGRPKGARNKTTIAIEALLDGAAEALTRKLIETALAGDGVALRFCVGRLLPARHDRPVAFDLPEIAGAGDLVKAARAILAACAGGMLSPREATEVMDLMTAVQALEVGDAETRVTESERKQQARSAKTSRDRAAQCDRRASRPARAGRSRREAFDVSGCEIERGIRVPRPVPCKSPVFNSLSPTPAADRNLQETLAGLGDRGDALTNDGGRMTDDRLRGQLFHQSSVLRLPPSDRDSMTLAVMPRMRPMHDAAKNTSAPTPTTATMTAISSVRQSGCPPACPSAVMAPGPAISDSDGVTPLERDDFCSSRHAA
jgi:hypothetical protein